MATEPLVSVVTPFFNTGAYLAECIESVLAQTYGSFEYLLVNNCSTDGSREIAASYAARDSRIRLFDNLRFVGQVENYNDALEHIGAGSTYCKIVQADDWIFPACLRAMVDVAERSARIGMVGSYYLEGSALRADGLPYGQCRIPGKQLCRTQILERRFFIGSPSSVLYRADIVRARRPFYELGRYHEDTEAAYEILQDYEFGFVHQVLSYLRCQNESTMGARRSFNPSLLDRLIILERYGGVFLDDAEFQREYHQCWRAYAQYLGHSLLRSRSRAFWQYHRQGLATVGRSLPWTRMLGSASNEVLDVILNPKSTLERTVRLAMSRWTSWI